MFNLVNVYQSRPAGTQPRETHFRSKDAEGERYIALSVAESFVLGLFPINSATEVAQWHGEREGRHATEFAWPDRLQVDAGRPV